MTRIHTPLALKLHAYGLSSLNDPNWTGMVLFDKLKQHTRGRVEPFDLLRTTLKKGLLYHIGYWFFEEYIFDENYFLDIGDEYKAWFLEDLYEAVMKLGVTPQSPSLKALKAKNDSIEKLYEEDEEEYFEYLNSEEGIEELLELSQEVIITHETQLKEVSSEYAANYADRVR